jgi:malate dehydrogenase
VSILGAGSVGGAAAAVIAARCRCDLVLYDVVEDLAAGKAMDLSHAQAVLDDGARVFGCDEPGPLAGSDLLVFAAGAPRRAGMKRRDLLAGNLAVLAPLAERVLPASPHAAALVVTNPVDALTALLSARWPDRRLLGLGCALDAVRLRYYLAEAAGTDPAGVDATVVGTHDEHMVCLLSQARIDGAPAEQALPPEALRQAVGRTRGAGAEIVARLRTRGSYQAAAYCIGRIVEAALGGRPVSFPLDTGADGAYGLGAACLALPCEVGPAARLRIVDLDISPQERRALAASRQALAGMLQPYVSAARA